MKTIIFVQPGDYDVNREDQKTLNAEGHTQAARNADELWATGQVPGEIRHAPNLLAEGAATALHATLSEKQEEGAAIIPVIRDDKLGNIFTPVNRLAESFNPHAGHVVVVTSGAMIERMTSMSTSPGDMVVARLSAKDWSDVSGDFYMTRHVKSDVPLPRVQWNTTGRGEPKRQQPQNRQWGSVLGN